MSQKTLLRAKQVLQLENLVSDSSCRAIAVLGPSGIGKSWLVQRAKQSLHVVEKTNWIEAPEGQLANLALGQRRFGELISQSIDAVGGVSTYVNLYVTEYLAGGLSHALDTGLVVKAAAVAPVLRFFRNKRKAESPGALAEQELVLFILQKTRKHQCVLLIDSLHFKSEIEKQWLRAILSKDIVNLTVIMTGNSAHSFKSQIEIPDLTIINLAPLTIEEVHLLLQEIELPVALEPEDLEQALLNSKGITRDLISIVTGMSVFPNKDAIEFENVLVALETLRTGVDQGAIAPIYEVLTWLDTHISEIQDMTNDEIAELKTYLEYAWMTINNSRSIEDNLGNLQEECASLWRQVSGLLPSSNWK